MGADGEIMRHHGQAVGTRNQEGSDIPLIHILILGIGKVGAWTETVAIHKNKVPITGSDMEGRSEGFGGQVKSAPEPGADIYCVAITLWPNPFRLGCHLPGPPKAFFCYGFLNWESIPAGCKILSHPYNGTRQKTGRRIP
jgi:hypothetical protein